jgi:hypothetical protein
MEIRKVQWMKTLMPLITAVTTILLAWFVGNRLSARWAIRQKRKELDLAAANRLYELYGEFFAISKLWNDYKRQDRTIDLSKESRERVIERAYGAEGGIEALFVKLASEKRIHQRDTEALFKFRQAFQQLRESIREGRDLPWHRDRHPEYLTFKRLSCFVAQKFTADEDTEVDAEEAYDAFYENTRNRSNGNIRPWIDTKRENRWLDHAG